MDNQSTFKISDWSTTTTAHTTVYVNITIAPHVRRRVRFTVTVDQYPEDQVNAFKSLRNFCFGVYDRGVLVIDPQSTMQQRALDLAHHLASCGCNVITVAVNDDQSHDVAQVTVTRLPTWSANHDRTTS